MQTDWHRYNLKRRVASLPPLDASVFAEKVLANKATAQATAAKAAFEKICGACQRTYYSENAYLNHLSSQKHRANVVRLGTTSVIGEDDTTSVMSSTFSLGETTTTEADSIADPEAKAEFEQVVDGIKKASLRDEDQGPQRPPAPGLSAQKAHEKEHPLSASPSIPVASAAVNSVDFAPNISIQKCLFCNVDSPTVPLNVHHMSKFHGMYIPEQDYLVDLNGLLNYLYQKIHDLYECLYCGQIKHTVSGVQTHMRDKGHCMIAFDSEKEMVEVGQFYDFSSTYSDAEEEDEEEMEHSRAAAGGGVKLGAAREGKTTTEDGNAVEEDEDGWESDTASIVFSVPTEELGRLPVDDHSHLYKDLPKHRHHSHTDPRPHKEKDGRFHSHAHHTPHAVFYDDYELRLPSGRIAGHRSLRTYYRQNLHSYPSPAERASRLAISASEEEIPINENMALAEADRMQRDRRGRQIVTRANGGLGLMGAPAEKQRAAKKVEVRDSKKAQRAENRYKAGNEKRANFQKHYRVSLRCRTTIRKGNALTEFSRIHCCNDRLLIAYFHGLSLHID